MSYISIAPIDVLARYGRSCASLRPAAFVSPFTSGGRHKASLVNAEEYLLTCYRYIEMNPVTAGMVMVPEQYRWSSYRWHAWGKNNVLISDHLLYQGLGESNEVRQHAYRELFKYQIPDEKIHEIRECLNYNYPLGNDRFKQQIEKSLEREVGRNQRGRPRDAFSVG